MKRARWKLKRKAIAKGLGGLLGALGLIFALALLALANLDARPMKGWLQGAARGRGVALDFDEGRVTLGGVRLRNLRVASPAADTALAPSLISVGAIDGSWSLWSRRLDELILQDVALTVVRDPDGTTSLDRWLAGLPPSPEEPPDPLSALASALPADLQALVRLENLSVAVIERGGPAPDGSIIAPGRATLTGLSARAQLAGGRLTFALGPTTLRLALSSAERDAAVEAGSVAEQPPSAAPTREALLELSGEAELTRAGHGRVKLAATLQRQTLTAALPPIKEVLALEASADFLAAERRSVVRLERLSLLDGAATLTARVSLRDGPTATPAQLASGARPPRAWATVDEAELRVDLPRLARAVPAELGPLELEGEPLVATVRDAALAPELHGELTVTGGVTRLEWRDVQVRGLGLRASAQPLPASSSSSTSAAPAADPGLRAGAPLPASSPSSTSAAPLADAGLRASLELPVASVALPGLTLTDLRLKLGAERRAGTRDAPRTSSTDPLAALWPLELSAELALGDAVTPTSRARGLELTAKSVARGPRELDATASVALASLDGDTAVERLQLALEARDLTLAPRPLQSTGVVRVTADVAAVRAKGGPRAKGLRAEAEARLAAGRPAAASLQLDAASLVVPGLAASLGRSFGGGALRLRLDAPALALDAAEPTRSQGEAKLLAAYGGAEVTGALRGSAAEVGWQLAVRAPRIGPARALTVDTAGTFAPASGRLSHDTTVAAAQLTTEAAAVQRALVHLVSGGTAEQHEGTATISFSSAQRGSQRLGATKLELRAAVDRRAPKLELELRGGQPPSSLRLAAAVDRARALRWRAEGKLVGFAALAPLLPPGPDWENLAVELDGSGVAAGVIASTRGGVPALVADPLARARGEQALRLTLRGLRYRDDVALTSAALDALTLDLKLSLAARRAVTLAIDAPSLDAVSSGVKLAAKALALRLDATLTPSADRRRGPLAGALDAKLRVRAQSARQSALPWYALREPALTFTANGDPAEKLALALAFANPGAGTRFEVAGDLERELGAGSAGVVARSSLALQGKLEQALDELHAAPETLTARGKVRVPFRVESGDLSLFRTTARVSLRDVDVALPAKKLTIRGATGELPIVQEVVLTATGLERVGEGERGLFSQLRFPDYKPLAGAADYLSIAAVELGGLSFGPIAGNARVDRDVVALDQLELSALGGKISGQCLAELRGADTQLAFRGKLTGIRPPLPGKRGAASTAADGAKLDANAAITITPFRYGLEGRTEIVRIGREHLLALLDLWDPYRSDVAANRVRLALKVGYPKQVRLHFARGFASLAIELGGLAGVVRIDEIRGIPIGPALAHWLAPILEQP